MAVGYPWTQKNILYGDCMLILGQGRVQSITMFLWLELLGNSKTGEKAQTNKLSGYSDYQVLE